MARSFHARTERGRAEEEKKIPSMDQCIMTKYVQCIMTKYVQCIMTKYVQHVFKE